MTLENLAAMVARGFEQTATKKELEPLATKKELELLATKKDLKQLATKKELMGVLEILDAMRSDLNYVRNSTKNLHLLERDVQDLQHRMSRLERRAGLARS